MGVWSWFYGRGGQPKPGVEKGPKSVIEAGLEDALKDLGLVVKDHGQLNFQEFKPEEPSKDSNLKNPLYVGKACEEICKQITSTSNQDFILNIGGDHSLAIGTISATLARYPDAGIIWVDAHGTFEMIPPIAKLTEISQLILTPQRHLPVEIYMACQLHF